MKLTVLGSGTNVLHPKRSASGYWLETAAGTILLDCGPAAPLRMAQEGLNWAELDAIWISHFHLDHCGGLAPFLAGTKYAAETRRRTKPLMIFGPNGITELVERFDAVYGYGLREQRFPVRILETASLEPFELLPGVRGVTAITPHTPESHAIHITDESETTLVFTADTGFHEPLAAFARHVDLFILESAFLKNNPGKKHMELAEAMFLIRKAEPKRAMLTHFYPEWDEVDFAEEVSRFDPRCEVIEAADGFSITVGA